jgi:SAM-dependent methyltransferase
MSAAALWTAYWRDADTDGCTIGFPAEVRQRLAAAWTALFRTADPGARLLDLAAGRGAVLAHAAAAGLTAIEGCDLAEPGGPLPVRGGVDLAALPYPDRAFDLVVSQFGIEYAGLAAALDEAMRVCRGRLVLLLHARESDVRAQALEQAEQGAWVIDELGLFAALRAPGPETATRLAAALAARARTAGNDALLRGLIALVGGPRLPAPAELAAIEADLAGHCARMQAMAEAAPDRAATAAAAARLAAAGFAPRVDELWTSAGALVGRWLIGVNEGETA